MPYSAIEVTGDVEIRLSYKVIDDIDLDLDVSKLNSKAKECTYKQRELDGFVNRHIKNCFIVKNSI